jgi:hypothetical protein
VPTNRQPPRLAPDAPFEALALVGAGPPRRPVGYVLPGPLSHASEIPAGRCSRAGARGACKSPGAPCGPGA